MTLKTGAAEKKTRNPDRTSAKRCRPGFRPNSRKVPMAEEKAAREAHQPKGLQLRERPFFRNLPFQHKKKDLPPGRPFFLENHLLQLIHRPVVGKVHLITQNSLGSSQLPIVVVEDLQPVMVEYHLAHLDAGILQLLAQTCGSVMARL